MRSFGACFRRVEALGAQDVSYRIDFPYSVVQLGTGCAHSAVVREP
jgi:hypothetical protein